MRVAIPGKMQDFGALKPGDVFIYFADGSQHWGMLSGMGEVSSPISFTEPIEKGLPTPCVHDRSRFENPSVLVIEGAEVRAIWPQTLKDGSPQPAQGIGSLIMTEKSTMVRAKGTGNCWDIDVTNGQVQSARMHPGSVTVLSWEIGFIQDGLFKQMLQFPKSTVQHAQR